MIFFEDKYFFKKLFQLLQANQRELHGIWKEN